MDEPSADLMTRWQGGDEQAADELVRRYTERLLALARSRLSARLGRHVDPEDAVQSAYRSFFIGAREGRYALERSGDLWRLLVAITLHKLHHLVERHTAQKRSVARECELTGEGSLWGLQAGQLAQEPSPEEAAALADELELVLRGLEPRQRRMIELRLQGYSLEEIAAATQRCERTVRRILEQVRQHLERRCQEYTRA